MRIEKIAKFNFKHGFKGDTLKALLEEGIWGADANHVIVLEYATVF